MTIGEKIKQKRIMFHLSKDELARRTKSSSKIISSWEKGKLIPTDEQFELLATALHTTSNELKDDVKTGQTFNNNSIHMVKNPLSRSLIRWIGVVFTPVGVGLIIWSIVDLAVSLSKRVSATKLFIAYIGIPLAAVGIICLIIGFSSSLKWTSYKLKELDNKQEENNEESKNN